MEAYCEALGQFEQEKAPMRAQLEQCAQDFARVLGQQYAPKTVRKHTAIIALFIDDEYLFDPVRRLLLGCRALKHPIGLSESRCTGGLGVSQMPEHPTTDNHGQ